MRLFKHPGLWASVFLSLTVISCHKSVDDPPAAHLPGTWNFAGMQVKVLVTSTQTVGGNAMKDEYTVDYATTNNKGTATFINDSVYVTDLSYSVHTKLFHKNYVNGMMVNYVDNPFDFDGVPSAYCVKGKVFGRDSLYSPEFIDPGAGLGIGVPRPSGYRYDITATKLTMTGKVDQPTVITGSATPFHAAGTVVLTYFRQ